MLMLILKNTPKYMATLEICSKVPFSSTEYHQQKEMNDTNGKVQFPPIEQPRLVRLSKHGLCVPIS